VDAAAGSSARAAGQRGSAGAGEAQGGVRNEG